jgi:serine O-acetyltransferase
MGSIQSRQILETSLELKWWQLYREDFARYRYNRPNDLSPVIFATEQGLWALLQYRLASALYRSNCPFPLKPGLLLFMLVWQKLVEITTGISVSHAASVGPGLYIGHFGNIFIHERAIIGHSCNVSQGVTIGISGRPQNRGVPVIGDRVHIGANAVVAGKLKVGDDVVIGANSLVIRDIPPSTTVMGVPARIVSLSGSADFIGSVVRPND